MPKLEMMGVNKGEKQEIEEGKNLLYIPTREEILLYGGKAGAEGMKNEGVKYLHKILFL